MLSVCESSHDMIFLISPQIASFHHHQYVTCPVTWLFANLLNSLLLQPLVCEFLAQQMCFWISFDSLLQQPPTVCVHFLAKWLFATWCIAIAIVNCRMHLRFLASTTTHVCICLRNDCCNATWCVAIAIVNCRMHRIWTAGKPPAEYQLLTSSLPPLAQQRCCPPRLCPPHRVWCGVRFLKIALARI